MGTLTDLINSVLGKSTLATPDALRAYTGPATTVTIASRGTGGVFSLLSSASGLSDNTGVIIIDGLGRAWKRLFTGPVFAEWFGAVGNNTDCSAAVQAAVNYLQSQGGYDVMDSAGILRFGPGAFQFHNIQVNHSGIRFGGTGKYATWLINSQPTGPMLTFVLASTPLTTTIGQIEFEDLSIRNTVNRTNGGDFLIACTLALRMRFTNVDLVSAALNPNANRQALKCDFITNNTWETKFDHCTFWGIIGCPVELPDGGQSDTVLFSNCIWMYCSISGAFGFGSGSGYNAINFESCKVVGTQGGSYAAAAAYVYTTTTAAATTSNIVQLASTTGIAVNTCIIFGRNQNNAVYAFVSAVNGLAVTLDRNVTVTSGMDAVSGRFGFVLAHVNNFRWSSGQFEGLDAGVYSVSGRRITVDNTIVGSCANGILVNSEFRYLSATKLLGSTSGTLPSGMQWNLINILNTTTSANIVDISDIDVESSGYWYGTPQSVVTNNSGFAVRVVARSRLYGPVYAGAQAAATFTDNAYLNFNRSATSALTQVQWQTAGSVQWELNHTNTAGDLVLRNMNAAAATLTLAGGNGIPQFGDGLWNSVPVKFGGNYVWVDSTGKLRTKTGSPIADTDGTLATSQVQLLFQSGTSVPLTDSTTETTQASPGSVPGNVVSANGSIEVEAAFTVNNSAGAKTVRVYYGLAPAVATVNLANCTAGVLKVSIQNANATGTQIVTVVLTTDTGATTTIASAAVDTTHSKAFSLSAQLASGTDNISLVRYSVKLVNV